MIRRNSILLLALMLAAGPALAEGDAKAGNKMIFVGLKKDKDRKNLIAYLKDATQWRGQSGLASPSRSRHSRVR